MGENVGRSFNNHIHSVYCTAIAIKLVYTLRDRVIWKVNPAQSHSVRFDGDVINLGE